MDTQSKSIFKSRMFWVNVGAAVLEGLQLVTDARVLPAGTASLAANVATVVLRRFTAGEVHIVTPRPVEPPSLFPPAA